MEEQKSEKGCMRNVSWFVAIIAFIFGAYAYKSGDFHAAANFYCGSSLFFFWIAIKFF